MRHAFRSAALCAGLLLFDVGCFSYGRFDPLHRGDDFDDAHKRFTQLLRWSQFDKASSFVEPDVRAEFLNLTAGLADVRFTDYDVVEIDLDEDWQSATVDVVFRAYRTPAMVEKTFAIRQKWQHDQESDRWRVRPQLAELPKAWLPSP